MKNNKTRKVKKINIGKTTKKNPIEIIIKRPYRPKKINPESDFYTYVNYQWLHTTKNIDYLVKNDNFTSMQVRVNKSLNYMIKKYISENKGKKATAIKNIYHSFRNLNEDSLKNHIPKVVKEIDEFRKDKNNLWKFLANINSNEVVSFMSPLQWSILPDEKNAPNNATFLNSGRLGLTNYLIYIDHDTNEKYKRTLNQYKSYINEIFKACLGKNHNCKADHVIEIEKELLNHMGCNYDPKKADDFNFYNKIELETLEKKYKVDYKTFFKTLGYHTLPKYVVCDNPDYLKCLVDDLTENWNNEKWRCYWLYIYLRQMIRFHAKWRCIHFKFNLSYIVGQDDIWPRWQYGVFGVQYAFNSFLANHYIQKNKNEVYEKYVKDLADGLRDVFRRRLENNTWMSKSTREKALIKLKNIKIVIGSPKNLIDDPILDYKIDDAWGNACKMANWKKNSTIKRMNYNVHADNRDIDWREFSTMGNQPYIVNAYYMANQNMIYIPSAYVQKPFIDLNNRGLEYILAFLGFTIAHEMTHAFDENGSKYDKDGNKLNWWTPQDRAIFKKKIKNVARQYEHAAKEDGIKLDGMFSIGENVADLGGLAICEQYLLEFLNKNHVVEPVQYQSFQMFYTYYAVQMRQKLDKDAVETQVEENPHPPTKYRTNCPLTRLAIFRKIYNIDPKDKMYWSNNDTIW